MNKIFFLNFFLIFQLQSCRMQLQTLQAQKNSVGTVYNSVTARIDTVYNLFEFHFFFEFEKNNLNF